jgi:hypothetical protein
VRRATALLGAAFLVAVGLLFAVNRALYDGIESLLPEDTQFAVGYDELRFRQFQLGADPSARRACRLKPLA